MLYGVEVTAGLADGPLRQVRSTIAAASFAATGGRSLTLAFRLHDTAQDPALVVNRAPVVAWWQGFMSFLKTNITNTRNIIMIVW